MPHIVQYLAQQGRSYDEDDLATLQTIYERLCSELNIPLAQKTRREDIAIKIFEAFDRNRSPQQLYKTVLQATRKVG